jgi:hypothetical protein
MKGLDTYNNLDLKVVGMLGRSNVCSDVFFAIQSNPFGIFGADLKGKKVFQTKKY